MKSYVGSLHVLLYGVTTTPTTLHLLFLTITTDKTGPQTYDLPSLLDGFTIMSSTVSINWLTSIIGSKNPPYLSEVLGLEAFIAVLFSEKIFLS